MTRRRTTGRGGRSGRPPRADPSRPAFLSDLERETWNLKPRRPRGGGEAAFTLIELLVVLGVIAILVALFAPMVRDGLESGRTAACASRIRQLHAANELYAAEHHRYVAASSDIYGSNRERWHGARDGTRESFDGARGPLSPYLGGSTGSAMVRQCPSFRFYARSRSAANAFETACGGYGYNDRGVGSRVYQFGSCAEAMERGMKPSDIASPAATVMFADTAFPQPYGSRPHYLIEYSFAEAYRFVSGSPPKEGGVASPSIHFRHRDTASVAWCDGHVTRERLSRTASDAFARFAIGWFGPADNSLFDPE